MRTIAALLAMCFLLPLQSAGTSPDIDSLRKSIHNTNQAVRLAALDELGALGEKASAAVPDLCDILRDPDFQKDVWTLSKAAFTLGEIGSAAKPAIPWLLRIMNNRHIESATQAEAGLAADKIQLQDRNPEVRLQAAVRLSSRGPFALAALWKARSDPDTRVRSSINAAIRTIESAHHAHASSDEKTRPASNESPSGQTSLKAALRMQSSHYRQEDPIELNLSIENISNSAILCSRGFAVQESLAPVLEPDFPETLLVLSLIGPDGERIPREDCRMIGTRSCVPSDFITLARNATQVTRFGLYNFPLCFPKLKPGIYHLNAELSFRLPQWKDAQNKNLFWLVPALTMDYINSLEMPLCSGIVKSNLVSFRIEDTTKTMNPEKGGHSFDYDGIRFRCGKFDPDSDCLRLCVLRPGCSLKFVPGVSIPPEATERVEITIDGNTHEVRSPDDLIGCVVIHTNEEALEYLRFFSSWLTSHLFRNFENRLEIFKAHSMEQTDNGVTLPEKDWNRLGLHEPSVKEIKGGFIIKRCIFKSKRDPYVDLFWETVKLSRDGKLTILVEDHIRSTLEDTKHLFFASYL
jgi:hypothetical protein